MFPHPECTKETRTSNSNRYQQQQHRNITPDEFLKTQSSSIHQPLNFRHDHYMIDPFSNQISNQPANMQGYGNMIIQNTPINTRDIGKMRYDQPVQSSFQNDYFMKNFETFNQMHPVNRIFEDEMQMNHLGNFNPVDNRRNQMEKTRLHDKKQFMNHQGGNLNNFVDLTPQHTRRDKPDVNTSKYTPMARTLAIPKDKL